MALVDQPLLHGPKQRVGHGEIKQEPESQQGPARFPVGLLVLLGKHEKYKHGQAEKSENQSGQMRCKSVGEDGHGVFEQLLHFFADGLEARPELRRFPTAPGGGPDPQPRNQRHPAQKQ